MGRSTLAAIVLAAGRSKRFVSSRSKLLHPLSGKALVRWPLDALRALGASPTIVVVRPDDAELRAACGAGVDFAVQRVAKGTGHAVLAARTKLASHRGPVLVMAGDLPLLRIQTLRKLVQAHSRLDDGLALLTADIDDPHGWGRIVRKGKLVDSIVEQRDATAEQRAIREVNVGVYCIDARLLFELLRQVRPDNVQGEIYLTDIVALALRRGCQVRPVSVDAAEVGQVNSRRELVRLEALLRTQTNERWMAAGVTIIDPDTTYIGPDVRVGSDTFIGPNVHLRGATRIGKHCQIDGSAFITDSAIGDGVHLRFGVVMTEAKVGRDCLIGPFAHLRPATRLGAGVHIGDFVETKNATLADGAKANHLAYIGDAEIGRETNVGAGTITCNYDGFRKHRTVVGDRVQIGSDTQLVAPVRLGNDVYVASGSTVRRNVPAGSLVYNPRDQVERDGWVAERRARERKK